MRHSNALCPAPQLKVYLNRILFLVWLLGCVLGFGVAVVSSVADQERLSVPGWGQLQAWNHPCDAGFNSGLDFHTEPPSVMTESSNDLACTVPTMPVYWGCSVSTMYMVGAPRAPPDAKAAFLAAKGPTRFIDGVKVTDRSSGKVLEGTVDLKPTLDRIGSGQKFPHRNDGSIFRNDQGLLPKQSAGYYKEYVHPTPGVSGPGPQRIISGQGGEFYYTPDH